MRMHDIHIEPATIDPCGLLFTCESGYIFINLVYNIVTIATQRCMLSIIGQETGNDQAQQAVSSGMRPYGIGTGTFKSILVKWYVRSNGC